MDVTRINGNNLSAANNIRIAGYSDRMLQAMKGRSEATPDSEPSVLVELSDEGRLASLLNKEFDLTDVVALKVDEGLLSAQGPLEGWVRAEQLTLERNILVASNGEIALADFIYLALKDKARDSGLAGDELAKMVNSAGYGNGATVEERAVNREIGMKNAQYIAETYFDDPDEAQAFLDRINRDYEDDILREKGYIVGMGTSAPYRSYSMPNAPNEFLVNGKATMKHFGASEEVLNDPEKRMRFLGDLMLSNKMLGGQYQKDIAEAFEKNEKEVASIIDKIRASVLNEADIANSLARILKAF